jgi:lipopolysaccharide heptosyltransferase I
MSALPGRILIVRTSALGDVVHCLPVLRALRRHAPRARIGWVVEAAMAPLFDGHPDLDDLLVVRLREWRHRPFARRTLGEIAAFLAALDRFSAEVVLDLMGNHKGGILAALTLADRRIGLASRFRREPSSGVWISQEVAPRGPHAVDRALSVAAALGLPDEPADFGGERLFRPAAQAAGDRAGEDGGDEPAYLLVHPGAAWANKRYPPEAWGEVAARLAAASHLELRVASGAGDEALAASVAAASGGAATIAEAPDLASLAALLRGARLVLGGDTGPIHLAHAMGVPVVCLMGPTDPRRHGPYAAPERALWVELPCSFCYKRLSGARPCLTALTPAEVAARALALLEQPTRSGAPAIGLSC